MITVEQAAWRNLGAHIRSGQIQVNKSEDKLKIGQLVDYHAAQAYAEATGTLWALKPQHDLHLLIVSLLNNLAADAKVTIMSLWRPNSSMHGYITPTGALMCGAVDIATYAGIPILITENISAEHKKRLIEIVCRMLSRFPDGKYDIGFPRPRGGDGFNEADDVFFPVTTPTMAQNCKKGRNISRPLSDLRPEAKKAVRIAVGSGSKFGLFYPDAKDHIHISASKNDYYPKPQTKLN